jgi:hypothetical protein
VNVSLDESRKDEATARVDDPVVSDGSIDIRSNRYDPSIANRHAALDDVEGIVHRDD